MKERDETKRGAFFFLQTGMCCHPTMVFINYAELTSDSARYLQKVRLLSYAVWQANTNSCGLRSGSAAAHLLGLEVRIPPRVWMFVCCECCVRYQVEVSASG